MAKESLAVSKLLRLAAVLCLLLTATAADDAGASLGADATAPKGPALAPASPAVGPLPNKNVGSCEAKQKEMQEYVRKLLRVREGANLRDKQTQIDNIKLICFHNLNAPANRKVGSACERSFAEIVKTLLGADDLVGAGCKTLKDAAEKAAACKSGEAACFKQASKNMKAAKAKLAEASKLLVAGASKMKELRVINRNVAKEYAGHLRFIALEIRKYQHQGIKLEKDSPEFENLIGPKIKTLEGDITARQLMHIYRIQNVDPAEFEQKYRVIAQEIIREENETGSGTVPTAVEMTTGVLPGQQVRAAYSALDAANYSTRQSQGLNEVGTALDAEATRLETLGRGFETAGQRQPAVSDRPASGAPTQVASNTDPRSGQPRSQNDLSAASRPIDSLSGASGTGPGQAIRQAGLAAMGSPSFGGAPAFAPARAASFVPRQAAAPARGPEAAPSAKKFSYPTEKKETEAEKAAQQEPVISQAAADPIRLPSPKQLLAATYPERKTAPESTAAGSKTNPSITQRAETKADLSPDSDEKTEMAAESSSAPQQKAVAEAGTKAIAMAEVKLSKLESGRRLPVSMRDLLRARLARDYQKKLNQGRNPASQQSDNGDSAHAVKSLIHDMELEGVQLETDFEMESSETELQVRQMIEEYAAERVSYDILGSQTVSLFERVRDTYQRFSRAGAAR